MKKFNEQIAKKETYVYKSNSRNRDRSKQVLYCNMNILKKLLNETSQNQKKILVDCRQAIISNYGPYIAVKEGFNSTSDNRLEISFPNNADISINQKKGFTLFFWCIVRSFKLLNNFQKYTFARWKIIHHTNCTIVIGVCFVDLFKVKFTSFC